MLFAILVFVNAGFLDHIFHGTSEARSDEVQPVIRNVGVDEMPSGLTTVVAAVAFANSGDIQQKNVTHSEFKLEASNLGLFATSCHQPVK